MLDIKNFCEYENFFSADNPNSFELLNGTGKVMISAPHSVEQIRNGKIKFSEPQTGVLARLLHDELGCPVIYKTKNCGDDANYDSVSPFKEALRDYIDKNKIEFLIDLHQLSCKREVMINIGTGQFKNVSNFEFVNIMIEAFSKRNTGLIKIDSPFDATYPYTVSSYISSKCKISAIQLELNSSLLRLSNPKFKAEEVYDALVEIIKNTSKLLQGE